MFKQKLGKQQELRKGITNRFKVQEVDQMKEIQFRKAQSQTRSLIEASPSPQKAALSTQGEDSWQQSSSGTRQNCKCKEKNGCSCKKIGANCQTQIHFSINKTENVLTKTLSGTKSTQYTVYHIEVQTMIGEWTLTYRFSEMQKFHEYVKKKFSKVRDLPKFPIKKIWKNDEKVVEERKHQLTEYFNSLNTRIDLLQDNRICLFLKIEGYMREYLNDLQNHSSADSPMHAINNRSISKMKLMKDHSQFMQLDDSGFQFDLDDEISMHSGNTRLIKNKSLVELGKGKTLFASQVQLDKKEHQICLYQLYKKHNLSEEEILNKFFQAIHSFQSNKDYYIRDLEDFYFQARPKFSPRLIRLLLEGDSFMRYQGLLFFMSEIEESFVSACSTLQFVSKLLDFQKNIYADSFIKEMAKIEPKKMRQYKFEEYLLSQNFEGYRLQVLNILYLYVDKRKTFKNTFGTFGNNDEENALESKKSIESKQESEEDIVQQLVFSNKIQEELILHIKAKQAQQQNFSTASQASSKHSIKLKSSATSTTLRKKSNFTFLIPEKSSSQRLDTDGSVNMSPAANNSSNTEQQKFNSEILKYNPDSLRFSNSSVKLGLAVDDLANEFFFNTQTDLCDIQSLQCILDLQLFLHHHNNNEDICFKLENHITLQSVSVDQYSIESFALHTVFASLLKAKSIKTTEKNQRILEVITKEGDKLSFLVQLTQQIIKQQNTFFYVISELEKQDIYCVVCLRASAHQSTMETPQQQFEIVIKIKGGFLSTHQTAITRNNSNQEAILISPDEVCKKQPNNHQALFSEEKVISQIPDQDDLQQHLINLVSKSGRSFKYQLIEKLVDALISMEVKEAYVEQDINPKFELIRIVD